MFTRKGNIRCDACDKKQKQDLSFLVLIDERHDDSMHFCSWDCIADTVAAVLASDLKPSDFSRD